jgi:hypothetical protein
MTLAAMKMTDQMRKAEHFRALHVPGTPLVLFNIWDAGSAKAVAASGAKAIATSSWSVANANGFSDGEQTSLTLAIENLRRIVGATDLPVTIDLEGGYGDASEAVGETIAAAISAGAIGCNLEDSFPASGKLRETVDQTNRIRRARQSADAANIPFFINARTDVFFQRPPEQDDNGVPCRHFVGLRGHGMLSELNHVEGNWSALIWAVRGAGVLAKHAMLALILPGSHRRTASSASELFAKEIPIRKATLTATAACVAASLLFFLAPVFRQGFQVSLAQWHDVLHVSEPPWSERGRGSELEALARKADQNHDAEALAFAASHTDQSDSVHLADEAIHLDPGLTWLYAIAGTAYLSPSEIDRRVSLLEQWDVQNALPHLFAAQEIGVTVMFSKEFPLGEVEENQAREKEMGAAFQSPKLDSRSPRAVESAVLAIALMTRKEAVSVARCGA